MSLRVFPKDKQGYGAFNGGQIVENKPIGFPQDHSQLRPYSNLFYWAHAKAVTDSTIGLHPHKGFEICSFVLAGQIRHFDTKMNDWRPLEAGDVQIIRSGSGISHSEWMGQGAEMFQIWFDPGLENTMTKPATYDDYKASAFPLSSPVDRVEIQHLVGGGSPFQMDTPGVSVQKITISEGSYAIELGGDQLASVYILEGDALLNGERVATSDFAVSDAGTSLSVETLGGTTLFVIISPVALPYRTYAQLTRG